MPPLDQTIESGSVQMRAMLLGEALLRKTDWIGSIAEAGFNVIYIDGDGNPQRLFTRSAEARKRIAYINAVDMPDNAAMGFFCIKATKGEKFIWNERSKQIIGVPSMCNNTDPHLLFDPSKLTLNDVLVLDSWTAMVRSFQGRYAKEQHIDIEASSTMDSDWSDYRWTGAIASKVAENLKKLPCHSVVVCHNERIEKKDPTSGKVIAVKNKPISTSRSHADTLPKNFTDVLHFSMVGRNIFIETQPGAEIVAGSRSFPPMREEWAKFQFGHFASLAGMKATGEPCTAIQFFAPGEIKSSTKPMTGPLNSGSIQTTPAVPIAQPAAGTKLTLTGLMKNRS